MLNKNLLFAVGVVAVSYAMNVAAVEVLRPEDEGILWEVQTDEGKTLHGVVPQVVSGGGQEEIIYREPIKPFRGPGLMSIPVPEEINQRARFYQNSSAQPTGNPLLYLDVKPTTERSIPYPIGAERREVDSWRRGGFLPNFRHESAAMTAHRKAVEDYKAKVADCRNSRNEQIDMEMSMLYGKQLFRNAAYLSETFEDMMQCYDDLGLEIIDVFYHGDNEVLRVYNQTTPQFEVKSSAPNFDTKYCQEGVCSLEAVAKLQLEKFTDFEHYLHQLLEESPVDIPFIADGSDVPMIDEAEVAPVVSSQRRRINIVDRPAGRQVRTVREQDVPMVEDDWDVPYVDEADF